MSAPDVMIGLEVHVYLRTRAKLFCACSADVLSVATANANVCPVCTGQPGSKPMSPNATALEHAVRVARALECRLRPRATFQRKHYFYPDLPSGYQRTSEPIGVAGSLMGVRIRELHVEEDPGTFDLATGLVADDRSGLPLLEIVTEPDMTDPAQTRRFLAELRLVLDYLDAGRDELGVKADVNVSVHGGERAEVKNVNSARNVERAATHEVERQLAAHARGERLERETRHFDEATGRTSRLRSKESEADYRYLPDPDLRPVDVAALDARLPREESPLVRRARIAELAGASLEAVSPLLEERVLCDAFERAAAVAPPEVALAFVVRDVRAELEYRNARLSQSRVGADDVVALVVALAQKRVTPHVATRLLRDGLDKGGLAAALHAETAQAGPAVDAVRDAARDVVAANPKAVADYRAGKGTAVNFLVGQAMKVLKGRADANELRRVVEEELRGA